MKNSPVYNELAIKPTGVVFTVEVIVSPSCSVGDTIEELSDSIGSNLDYEVIACEVVDVKIVTNNEAELRKIATQRAYKER